MKEEIKIKRSFIDTAFAVFLSSLFIVVLFYFLPNDLFYFQNKKNHVEMTLFLLFAILVNLTQWLKFFDTKPIFIVNEQGVYLRKYSFPFSPLSFITWDNVVSINLRSIKQKRGYLDVVEINKKDSINYSSINLDALGSSAYEVFEMFKKYAVFYDYRNKK